MTAQNKKKEEKKKLKESESVSVELSNISDNVSEAIKAQKEIAEYGSKVFQAFRSDLFTPSVCTSLQFLGGTLQSLSNISSILKDYQPLLTSLNFKAFSDIGLQTRAISESLTSIGKMMELPKIEVPKLEVELSAIPTQNNTLVKTLVRQIEYLENELAKEKTINKELIALLEEKRKELKKQYVS
jgi:hypothetical protein